MAVKAEGLVRPKKIAIYERKKFPKSFEGQYGEANVRQRKGGVVTSASEVFVRRMPAKNVRLTNDQVKQGLAHELSHLKYSNHTIHQRKYARKLYQKYLGGTESV